MRKRKRGEGRVIMSRVCGDKQSVAERASAHRIRVRDLRLSRACISYAANEMRSRRAHREIRGRLVLQFRLGSSLFRDAATDDREHIAIAVAAATTA